MTTYVIWGSSEHGQYCLARETDVGNIFGEGKLPNWGSEQLVIMELPNDDAAVFMYRKYFDALDILAYEVIPNEVLPNKAGLPVWSRVCGKAE